MNASPSLVAAHDVGTRSVKSVLLDGEQRVVATAVCALEVYRPQPRHVEQKPAEWLAAIANNTRALLSSAGVGSVDVRAMSFATQMQGTLLLDESLQPLHDAMIWLDMRAEAEAKDVVSGWPRVSGYGAFALWQWLRITNGVPGLSGRESLARLAWLRRHRPDLLRQARWLVDVKDFLLAALTGQVVTSHDMGNTTWLMDTRPGRIGWSAPLVARVGLPLQRLPALRASVEVAGRLHEAAAAACGLQPGTPVLVGAGDLLGMALGVGARDLSQVAIALGTSAWVSSHVAKRCYDLSTYTASICGATEGEHLVVAHQEQGGECLQWMQRQLGFGSIEEALDAASAAPAGSGDLWFAPWFNGEYAPVDDAALRGGFVGLSFDHDRRHMARAVLEGVAHNIAWALGAVEKLAGRCQTPLRIGGGGARSDLWCQIIADVCERPVERTQQAVFAVARGAGVLAYPTRSPVPVDHCFVPAHERVPRYRQDHRAFLQLHKQLRPWFWRRHRERLRSSIE